jgi:DNA-binding NarL/FixJ family response regulator
LLLRRESGEWREDARRLYWSGSTAAGTQARVAESDCGESLSEREREIFQLITEGRSNKAIADLLSVSPSTVETHRAHILQKLDMHSTAEIVLYAVRRGVIS